MNRKKRIILVILELILVIGVTVGVTLAFLSYTKEGTKENTIAAGAVTFHYNEDSGQGISLIDALPISDGAGQTQNNYFDFTITSNNNTEATIPYTITSRKVGSSANRIDDQYIKVYLTSISTELDQQTNDEVIIEDEILLDNYNNLNTITKNNNQEQVLYSGKVPSSTVNYEKNYRLRIWLDSSLDFSPEKNQDGTYKEVNGEYVYPNNNKQFSIKINVYAENHIRTQQDILEEANTNIDSLKINNIPATQTGEDIYELTVNNNLTPEIVIDTENDYATVKIEKTDSTYETVISANINTGIVRLSTKKTLSLTEGDNYFRIIITPEDVTKPKKTIKLKITATFTFKIEVLSNQYPILTSSGVVAPDTSNKVDISINYPNSYVQKLYKIDDGQWIVYQNNTISLNYGQTIYAKGIDSNSVESSTITYTAAEALDIITSEAYDGDWNTYMTYALNYNNITLASEEPRTYNNSIKYMKIDSSMLGGKVRVKWFERRLNYYGKPYIAYIDFVDENGDVISGYEHQIGDSNLLTQVFNIPNNAHMMRYYAPIVSNSEIDGMLYEVEPVVE